MGNLSQNPKIIIEALRAGQAVQYPTEMYSGAISFGLEPLQCITSQVKKGDVALRVIELMQLIYRHEALLRGICSIYEVTYYFSVRLNMGKRRVTSLGDILEDVIDEFESIRNELRPKDKAKMSQVGYNA